MTCNGVRVKSILDPTFCYTSSLHTDVRKTFERVRREQREAASNEIRSDRKSNVLTWQRNQHRSTKARLSCVSHSEAATSSHSASNGNGVSISREATQLSRSIRTP